MRMEAKNSYFKRIAQIGNFKNLPFSVCQRHQRLMCAYLQGTFFTYYDLECGPCKSVMHLYQNYYEVCMHAGKDSTTGTFSEQPPDIQEGIRNVLPYINPLAIITRFVIY